jgi:SET and MYND domain-containing protein
MMISHLDDQQFSQHELMDFILLSHFLGRIPKMKSNPPADDPHDPFSVFLSLLPGSYASQRTLDSIPKSLALEDSLVQDVYSRFGNNNFTIHSHLNSIGHGVFPLASRLFNHSCLPNAAPRYVLCPAQPVLMEVVALRDINIGEEVRH